MYRKRDLFREIHPRQEKYNGPTHIAEMIAPLGPPPQETIDREKKGLGWKSRPEMETRKASFAKVPVSFTGSLSST